MKVPDEMQLRRTLVLYEAADSLRLDQGSRYDSSPTIHDETSEILAEFPISHRMKHDDGRTIQGSCSGSD
jgi:hypothetical protein